MTLHPVLSGEQILEQVKSNKLFYNNTQNVETPHISAVLSNDDDELLAQIGYKPELKRHFSTLQVFGVAFSIMGLLPSIASVLSYGFLAGPSGLLYGWIISSLLILSIGYSMAVNGSSIPTSGGLYYWTNYYAPPKLKTVISYLVGNTNSIALVGALCSIDYGFSQELLSIVVIAKDGDFEVTPSKTYGVFVACVLTHILITCASLKNCSWLQTTSIIVNVVLIIFFIIALPIGARNNFKSASFVFANFDNLTNFPIGWVQLSQAWLPAIWTIGAFDSVVHMSEECANATRAIPIGILGSITACGSIGTIIIIVILFCIQTDDIETHILGSKFGQPLAQIIYDVLGKKWAIFFMVFVAIAQWMMGASTLTAISRQIWAFARDNGLPFSFWIKRVNKKLSVPINAVITGGVLAILIGLLCIIGTAASTALFTLYIAGNYFAWGVPTLLRLTTGRHLFEPGPFYHGKLINDVIGWISTIFIAFSIVMVMFPSNRNPSVDDMNYTCVITPGVWILSLGYYLIYAHKIYHGPRKTVAEEEEDADEEERAGSSLSDNAGFSPVKTEILDGVEEKLSNGEAHVRERKV
ncbi:amino acid transporter [Hyphopichia burtonii NRRL Y-1933]|uniref:Amino acid transporter n=1 Tax=Hyphopichia burtonii NRRL Y-1933 TaxID=984485 RepID=A0A1E4REG9_9ASCO|nr:amino acid transporter [Hyphopichia burtonii NRRL Y-1933]ODV65669.1 amino acid transporter [Hyphopichia burtonii NRRL Y-1933]